MSIKKIPSYVILSADPVGEVLSLTAQRLRRFVSDGDGGWLARPVAALTSHHLQKERVAARRAVKTKGSLTGSGAAKNLKHIILASGDYLRFFAVLRMTRPSEFLMVE